MLLECRELTSCRCRTPRCKRQLYEVAFLRVVFKARDEWSVLRVKGRNRVQVRAGDIGAAQMGAKDVEALRRTPFR